MPAVTTISTKGQLTIPAAIRKQAHLQAGDRVRFVVDDDGGVMLLPVRGKLTDLYGVMRRPDCALTIEEMEQSIADGASECTPHLSPAPGDARD